MEYSFSGAVPGFNLVSLGFRGFLGAGSGIKVGFGVTPVWGVGTFVVVSGHSPVVGRLNRGGGDAWVIVEAVKSEKYDISG